MMENEEVDHLQRRLRREGAGEIAELSNRAMDAMTTRGSELVSWVRDMADERPLISLLVACQIGFAIGRWGPSRAKH